MTTFGVETWHPNPRPFYAKGSGPLYDMAPYYLSALISLLGPIESIAAFSAKPAATRRVYTGEHAGEEIPAEVDTHYSAVMRMRSGVVVSLNVSFDIYRSDLPMFEICGDGGTLAYPDPNFGGGAPRVYRKEQYIDPVYRDTEEARKRKEVFYELPELFLRPKDYSRGIGVADLAHAIETGGTNRTRGMIVHVIEAITGLMKAAETGSVYRMESTCERPAPLKPGAALGDM
jgi:predicted dehydrogenase